jgi:UPF0755 protein
MRLRRWLVNLVLIAIAVTICGYVYLQAGLDRPIDLSSATITYEIRPGTTMIGLSRDLEMAGLLPMPASLFELYGRLTARVGPIKAGEYELTERMSARDILTLFRVGRVIQRQVTFVEGWTFSQWRALLAQTPGVVPTLDGFDDHRVMQLLGQGDTHAEGRFFPDTYHYLRGDTDMSILARALRRMQNILAEEWATGSRFPVVRSFDEALVLASIVEKETGYEPDRVRIAGVFLQRLAEGMRLQSDPTVIYGIQNFNGNLTRADLTRAGPYNTYMNEGLPPTPICNPGLASIRAVMHPVLEGDYYFVARGDGSSEFSATLEAHNAAVARFQKRDRAVDYRSVPGRNN